MKKFIHHNWNVTSQCDCHFTPINQNQGPSPKEGAITLDNPKLRLVEAPCNIHAHSKTNNISSTPKPIKVPKQGSFSFQSHVYLDPDFLPSIPAMVEEVTPHERLHLILRPGTLLKNSIIPF